MASKFVVVEVKRTEFKKVEDALRAVTPDTTEIREVTEHGEIGLNIADLMAKTGVLPTKKSSLAKQATKKRK